MLNPQHRFAALLALVAIAGVAAATPAASDAPAGPAPPPEADADPDADADARRRTLDPIIVVGDAFSETDGFLARQASTGSRFPVDVERLPNTIRILPQELFDATQATLPQDVTRYVSGVQPLPGFGTNVGFVIRGFFANYETLFNGVRASDSPGDLSGVERIEVLKGPIGSLYGGTGAFAGNVNLIGKRPLPDFAASAKLRMGSEEFRRFEADVGGPLSDGGGARFRLTGAAEDAGSFRDFSESDKRVLSPSLEVDWADNATLRLDASLLERRYTFDEGLPAAEATFELPLSRTLFPSDGAPTEEDYRSFGLENRWQLTDALEWRLAALRSTYDIDIGSTRIGAALREDGRTVDRQTFEGPQDIARHTIQSDLILRTTLLGEETVFLLGYEHFRNRYDYDVSGRELPPLDLLAGGNPPAGSGPLEPLFSGFSAYVGDAVYAQAFTQFDDRWSALVGIRYDEQTNRSEFNGSGATIEDAQPSPRVGVTWRFRPEDTLFADWATSFSPNFALDRDGDVFAADEVRQVEFGWRRSLADGRALLTVSAFDIKRSNVVIPDIDNFAQSIAAGEQTSRGIELDATGRLAEGLDLIATYAYTRAKAASRADPNFGQTLPAAPRHGASLFAVYSLRDHVPGLEVSLGAVYNGEIEVSLPNTVSIEASTRFDLGLRYGFDAWTVALNVQNATDDESYTTNLFSLFPQPPRSYFIGLERTF